MTKQKCSYSTQKLDLLSVASNPGSIKTKNIGDIINSMQFINPTESQELLIVSGCSDHGCQIYERKGSSQASTLQLRQSLKFEDSDFHNCCLVKGKYFFTVP
jgi:hypothetical protein